MKKILSLLLVFAVAALPLTGADHAPTEYDYETNQSDNKNAPLGYGTDEATHSTINMSMVGWGLGLAIAIAIIAGVVHQSAATHSSSTTTDSGS